MNSKKIFALSLLCSTILMLYLVAGAPYVLNMINSPYLALPLHLIFTALIGSASGFILKRTVEHAYLVGMFAAFYTIAIAEVVSFMVHVYIALPIIVVMAGYILAVVLFENFFKLKQLSLIQKSLIATSVWVVLFVVCRIVSLYIARILA